jgi:hypothetical protein
LPFNLAALIGRKTDFRYLIDFEGILKILFILSSGKTRAFQKPCAAPDLSLANRLHNAIQDSDNLLIRPRRGSNYFSQQHRGAGPSFRLVAFPAEW